MGLKLWSPAGFGSWAGHWTKAEAEAVAVAVELALEESESRHDHMGIWGAMVCRWAREIEAEPRLLSPSLAQAFLQSERPLLTPALPRDVSCFRLFLPRATLFSEEGPEIRSVLVADVRSMEGWLPETFRLAGGGLACVGLGEDGATYLASCLLDPSAKAQQPEHTDFSAPHWEWDADGVKGTAARMEQLCVHALLVQLYAPELVSEGEVPRPVWLGREHTLVSSEVVLAELRDVLSRKGRLPAAQIEAIEAFVRDQPVAVKPQQTLQLGLVAADVFVSGDQGVLGTSASGWLIGRMGTAQVTTA